MQCSSLYKMHKCTNAQCTLHNTQSRRTKVNQIFQQVKQRVLEFISLSHPTCIYGHKIFFSLINFRMQEVNRCLQIKSHIGYNVAVNKFFVISIFIPSMELSVEFRTEADIKRKTLYKSDVYRCGRHHNLYHVRASSLLSI